MKRGGSKAVRATRLREGLLRLKAETLAGIYNGKAFDDMSEFELRYMCMYVNSNLNQPPTTPSLRSCVYICIYIDFNLCARSYCLYI